MKFYNPISQSIETFHPKGETVTIYVCGITPYDTTHLGHAFTYTVADILIRYLEYRGYTVRYVQNVTDIDDDILRKGKEVGEDWIALGNRWTAHFIRDMIRLNVRPPDFFPRATETVPEIIDSVDKLIEAGKGYEKNGSVYYAVETFEDFGRLSHMTMEEMLPVANERGNNPDDPNKRNPLDFVLWQAQSPGEPAWDSPWGPGRPGWHIECSSMSSKYLGDTIDFHSGGEDLLFPHHECEIAQTEPITEKKPFVRFWLHAAMVRHEGEKMSKSLGNLVWANNLLKTYSADAIRLYLAMHHYQIEWSMDSGQLDWAARLSNRLAMAVKASSGNSDAFDPKHCIEMFKNAMDDNLNTPAALAALDELAVETLLASAAGREVREAQQSIRQLAMVIGLVLDSGNPEPRVEEGWNRHLQKFS